MFKERNRKNKRADDSVSEVIGVILLLMMSLALFSTVYIFIMNEALNDSGDSLPAVNIAGTVEGNDIVLENRGGEALTLDSKVFLNIAGVNYNMTIGDLLDNESKVNGLWDIGEKLSYISSMNVTGRQVEITVVDGISGSIVMRGILQEGETSVNPVVLTRFATDVTSYSAKLWMDYDFKNYSGYLGFAWKPSGGNWTYSSPSLGSGSVYSGTGSYTEVISGLAPNTLYWFKAQLRYGPTTIDGSLVSFNTLGWAMGLWHFNESTGVIAYDSSGHTNDGTLKPDAVNRPIWSNTTVDPRWTSWVNGSALSFDGIDDYVEVPDDDTLDLTSEVSIEAWVKPLEHSEGLVGDIKPVIDTSEFGPLDVYEMSLIHVSGDIYAIACRGTDNDGFLITLRIGSNGMIKDSVVDSFEFDISDGRDPKIIHVDGDIYAIAYTGPDDDGWLKTVRIANNGTITDSVVDSFEFDPSRGVDPSIIHVNGSLYAIAYTGSTTGGYLITLEIASNGTITKSIKGTLAFDVISDGEAGEFDMVHVDGDTYAMVYNAPDEDGRLRTVKIENDGNISEISTLKFDSSRGIDPDIIHVDGDIYAIAYRGFNNAGRLRTVEIASDGTILSSFQGDGFYTDGLKFSEVGGEPSIICVNGSVYAIVYRGSGEDGYVDTVDIASNGTINQTVIDVFLFDTSRCYEPDIISVNRTNHYYALTYRGYRDDGLIRTVDIASNGTINHTVIDSQEFGIFDCYEPDMVHISSDIYAIASRGLDNDGYVRTVKIASNGSITDLVVDALEFDTSYGQEPNIIHVNGDVYAIAYTGPGYDGWLKTVRIASNGTIASDIIDASEFDTSYGREPNITCVNGDVYAIAYRGPSNRNYLKTVKIASNGTITDTVHADGYYIDSLKFDSAYSPYSDPCILHANGSFYAIAYTGSGYDGYLATVEIANNGIINHTVIDTLRFDSYNSYDPDIIHVDGDVYAIAYRHNSYYGYLATVEIANNGIINHTVIDTLRFDSSHGTYGYDPDIIHINGRVYAVAYRDYYGYGFIKTVRIGENGNIGGVDDYLQLTSKYMCYEPYIIHVNDDVYAIAYRGRYGDAYVKTIKIDLEGTVRRILSKDGAYGISANSTRVFATINTHSQIISAPLSPGFNYVVFTYNKDNSSEQLKLYINGTEMANGTLTEAISTNTNKVYIGGVNAILDEIAIYGMELSQADVTDHYNTMMS